MKKHLETVKAQIAVLKTAPLYIKAQQAERTLDALVDCLADFEQRILKLEERSKVNGDGT